MHHFTWKKMRAFQQKSSIKFVFFSMTESHVSFLLLEGQKVFEHELLGSPFSKQVCDNQQWIWTHWKSMVKLTFSPRGAEIQFLCFIPWVIDHFMWCFKNYFFLATKLHENSPDSLILKKLFNKFFRILKVFYLYQIGQPSWSEWNYSITLVSLHWWPVILEFL